MAGTPLAEAFVRVRALTDKFRDDVKDGFSGLGDDFGKQFSKDASARLKAERGTFETEGQQIGAASGTAAGREFADGMKGNGVKFGDDASPFVAVGKKLGAATGDAAGKEFAKAMSKEAGAGFSQALDPIAKFRLQLAQAELAARRTGLAAKEAADRAVEGSKRAAAAAEQVTKGEKERADATEAAAKAAAELAEQVVKGEVSKEEAAKRSAKAAQAAAELVKKAEREKADAVRLATAASRDQEKAEIAATSAQLAKVVVSQRAAQMAEEYRKAQAGANVETDRGRVVMGGLATVAKTLGGAFASAASSLSLVGAGAAGVAGLGAAASSAAGYVVALAGELAPLAGLMAGLPGIALVGAAAFSVWKLATSGLGEAFKTALTGTYEQFAEAIADMTEAGKAFALEFKGVSGALRDFQSEVQAAFVSEMSGRLAEWTQQLLTLRPAVLGLASEFGALVRTVLDFATSEGALLNFTSILRDTKTLVGALRESLGPLLLGFVELGSTGSRWLAGFAPALRDVLTTFGEWMSEIARSGVALGWLQDATVVLQALGAIATDVWGIFTGLLNAGRDAGTGALGVLGQLVDKFNAWVNSAQGQDALVTVFKALDEVGRALVPVLSALGGAVAAIAPEAAKVATALGPVLAEAITVLGKGIAAMGPGLVKMVESFGRMVTAIGPLEPLGSALGDVFAALGGALALVVPEIAKIAVELAPALAAALAALGPALAELGPGLVAIARALAQAFASEPVQAGLLALGKALSDLVIAAAPLIPHLTQIAGILLQVLGGAVTNLGVALAPVIAALATALEPALVAVSDALALMIPFMEPIYRSFGEIGAALINQVLPPFIDLIPVMINALIPAFAELLRQIEPLIPLLADLAVKFVQDILPALLPVLPQLTELSIHFAKMGLVVAQLVADLAPFIERMIAIFQYLYDRLVGHSIIPDLINGMTQWFRDGVEWIKGIVSWFGELPGLMGNWLGALVGLVEDRWNLIRNAVSSRIDDISNKIADVLDLIRERWDAVWTGLNNFLSARLNDMRNAVSGGVDGVLGYFRNLPGQIVGALGNLSSLLWDSGRSLVQGLIDGLYSMLQNAYNAAADILNQIRGLFPFSPAKEGPFSGKGWTLFSGRSMMAGLAEGIAGQQAAVTGALDSVLAAGAATLGAGLQVPVAAMAGPTPALGFADSFAAPIGASPVAAAGPRTFVIENLTLQGVFDPSNPVSYRRTVERLRAMFIELEEEEYANG